MQNLPTKIADEIWQCAFDLSAWIGEGNSVATFDADVVSGSIIVSDAELSDGATGAFRVSGGRSCSSSIFRAFATMTDGQVYGETFRVSVE